MRAHHKVYARREWHQKDRFLTGGDPRVHAAIDPLGIALRITLEVQIRQNLGERPPW